VSFAAITLCVASQRVFIIVVYFIIDSVRKLLDTPSYLLIAYYFHSLDRLCNGNGKNVQKSCLNVGY
jgi:hypothetical protein